MTITIRRRGLIAAIGLAGVAAVAAFLVPSVVAMTGEDAAGWKDDDQDPIQGGRQAAGDELEAVRLAAAGELKDMRLTLAMGKPLRFPITMKVAGIGDLGPQQAVKIRALADAGILRTAAAGDGSITISLSPSGPGYDPDTGLFSSVGRKLVQVLEARLTDDAAGCCCLVQSMPDWPTGVAPRWAETLFNARVFPEFEGPGSRQDTLFFERQAGAWKLTQATMPSVRLRRRQKA